KREKVDFVIAVVISLNVLAAGSRTAILAAGLAGLGIVICLMKKRPKLAWASVAAVLLAAVYFIPTDYFTENVLRESSLENASNRVAFWEYARTFIERRPVLGHGFGVDAMVWQYYGYDKQMLQLRGYGVMSSYYGMAVVLGKPVAYAFFTSFWAWVLYGLYKYRTNIVMVGYLLTIVAGLVTCVFEAALYSAGNAFAYLFWIVVMLYLRRDVYKRNGIKLNKRGGLQRKAKKARRTRTRERKPTKTVEAAAASQT
ncbi:O-antigen ligase family protein, partial [Akkermansiaceae bacterium]|nr:O-antigen ligase family protein [Akkermansiaceae bacterium]